jgi:WD40 repeat protein/serine/threonine protein kinase
MNLSFEHLRGLSLEQRAAVAAAVDAFDAAWQHNPSRPPELAAFLPDDSDVRTPILIELACIDLERRLKRGLSPRVEQYLHAFPELATDAGVVWSLLVVECGHRRLEPQAAALEYERRFPQHQERLLAWLATVSWSPLPAGAQERFPVLQTGADPARTTPAAAAAQPGQTPGLPAVPGYELLSVLGHGGMGVVYQARQVRLGRVVALKMILAGGHAGAAELARFQAEAEAVARLQHPGIVQIHETGIHDGLPYFSLEFCSGGSLDRKLQGTPLPPPAAARLTELLARALQAAHEEHILHRDLKSANVFLLPARDGDGIAIADPSGQTAHYLPKIGDFGLAKKLEAGPADALTQSGAVMGTPSYMAPEQAGGKSSALGPAADVYGLGAILYELLTGRPPFRSATVAETLRQVMHDEPVPPSRLNPGIPRDLETIALKCLQKEPGKRYGSARELAEDLGRYLRGEPVRARPVGRLERGWRWCRRNPAVASLLAAVAATLLLGTAVATALAIWGWRNATTAEQREREAVQEKEQKDRQLTRAEGLLYAGQIKQAQQLWEQGYTSAAGYARDLLDSARWDYRNFEHDYLHTHFIASHLTFHGHTAPVSSVAFSPDGTRIASGGGRTDAQFRPLPGEVKVWDARSGQEVLSLKGHLLPVTSVAFSPDGTRLASGAGNLFDPDKRGEVKVWDARTGRQLLALKGHASYVNSVAFSPDGKLLASGSGDINHRDKPGEVKVWDAQTGRQLLALMGHTGYVFSVAFSPDGTRLASAGTGGQDRPGAVKVWDVHSGQQLLVLQEGNTVGVLGVAFSPDGKRLASGSSDASVKVWDAQTGKQLLALQGHTGGVSSVRFSPDGKRLASGASDATVRVWDTQSGQEVLVLKGHRDQVRSVAFSPDGTRIVSGSHDQTVKVWDAQSRQQLLTLQGRPGDVTSVAFSPDGERIIAAGPQGGVRAWDGRSGQEIVPCTDPPPPPRQPQAVGPDGQRLVRIVNGQPVVQPRVWRTDDWFHQRLHDQARTHFWHLRLAQEARQNNDDFALHFHLRPLLLTAFRRWQDRPHDSFPLWAWRPPLARRPAPAAALPAITLTEDELRRLLEELDRQVQTEPKAWEGWAARGWCHHLLDAAGAARADLKRASELHPDEPGLWALRGTVCLLHQDPDGAEAVRKRLANWQGVNVAVWHSVEANTCAAEGDWYAARWHWSRLPERSPPFLAITRPTASLHAESTGSVESLAFSPDGKLLAAGCEGKTVQLWDPEKGSLLKTLTGHTAWVKAVAFSHDGKRLASSGSDDRTVKVWDVQAGKELLTLKGHDGWTAGVAFSPDDKLLATAGEDQTVKLRNAETGAEVKTLKGHTLWVWGVAFSPDGDVLASASGDRTIKLWNVATGAEIRTLTGHTDRVRNLAFSPDGKRLASCSWDSTVRVWDTATGREVRTLKGHLGFTLDVAFSPDGKWVVSSGTDRTVRLWDAATGEEQVVFLGHGDGIACVALSPDGRRLATGCGDQTVRVWELPTRSERR